MIEILIGYWILTTIYGVYWLIKHPSSRNGDDMEHFSVMEMLGYIVPAMMFGWVCVPIMLLSKIEFKR